LHERIVVALQPGPRAQHVALQRRVIEHRRPHRLERALVAVRIRRGALDQEIGQQQQQTNGNGDQRARPHPAARSAAARDRPWYSPVNVSRNCTIKAMSSGGSSRPSWLRAMISTASASEDVAPLWKYGAVMATLRRLGTRKTCRSSSAPVSAKRPRSASVSARGVNGSWKMPNRWNRLPPRFMPWWQAMQP